MTDRDKQIIEETTKAVKDNLGAGCYVSDLLNIIISLQAENNILRATIDSFTDIGKLYSEIKADAMKEFAERLKEEKYYGEDLTGMYGTYVIEVETIDSLLEELMGEDNAE